MSKQPHLSELFQAGESVTLSFANYEDPENPHEYRFWFQRPHPMQREEAMTRARAKQARRQMHLSDKNSDEYLANWQTVNEVGDVDALAEKLVEWDYYNLRQQAYNEVLHSEEVGSDWGVEGRAYLDLVNAIQDRFEEIIKLNEGLSDEDQHLVILPEKDKEMQLLQAEQEKFEGEVEAQLVRHRDTKIAQLKGFTAEQLRQQFLDKLMESEAGLTWMAEYRVQMLRFIVRDPDDHKKFYFSDVEAIWDLPEHVRSEFFAAYEGFDRSVDDIKNLLSLQPS